MTVPAPQLPDADALADLATFVGRAKLVDPDGVARLAGHGRVLAVYVSPLHGAGGPTVLGLRTTALVAATEFDVTVSLAALEEELGRNRGRPAGTVELVVPATQVGGAAWAGVAPPRSGWEPVGRVDAAVLRIVAASGIAEVASGAPSGSGTAAVARLRAAVWSRPLDPDLRELPAGVAFAAEALGFLVGDEPAAAYRRGPWTRLSTARGHALTRLAPLS